MFLLSILLIVLSSWLIVLRIVNGVSTHQLISKKDNFIYFFLIAFAQIVLSFEVLSLFSAISKNNFLICNIIFLLIGLILFRSSTYQLINLSTLKKNLLNIFNALKRDKFLMFLSICFILFLIFQLMTIFFYPVTFGDAISYYFPRCLMWLQNGTIAHYVTADTRELIMPVNMDFLYTWVMMFNKSEHGTGIFSFLGYLFMINVLYNLLDELKFNVRNRLWAIFVFSSFALVIMEMVTPCADMFIGALILGSIYLFLRYVKYNDKTAIFFSSLSYALAIGTKTTAITVIPSVFLIMCLICYIYSNTSSFKSGEDSSTHQLINLSTYQPFILFCCLFILNFIIFSSYNYILNFIEFSSFVSNSEQYEIHHFVDGIKGYIANVIKYSFAFFDMSGMPEFININGYVERLQNIVLALFGVNITTGTTNYFPVNFVFSNKMGMTSSFLGIMGLLVFVPSIIYSIKHFIKNKKYSNSSTYQLLIASFGLSFIINLLIFSGILVFASYNMRYFLTFVCIASPILAYSYPYKNKFCKIFLCLIMFIYFIIFAHYKPFVYIVTTNITDKPLTIVKYPDAEKIYEYLLSKKPNKIGIMTGVSQIPVYVFNKIALKGVKLQNILLHNIESYDFSDIDFIITNKEETISTSIINFEDRIKNPEKYVSSCVYQNNKQEIIKDIEKKKEIAIEVCNIPFEYLEQKGFIQDNNIKNEKYIVLKRK